ncbi:MAG: ABC transporter permease [Nitriliruptoraceae bacterium]
MIRAVLSQWVRLCRRSVVLGWGGAAVAFSVLATYLTLRGVGSDSGGGMGSQTSFMAADLAAADGMAMVLGVTAMFLGVLTLGLVATLVANEYSHGTIRTLLLEQPRRLRLLGGQLIAIAMFTAAAVVVASLAATAVGLAIAPGQGVDTAAWLTAEGYGALAASIGNLILSTLGWGMIGALLAVLLRSPAPAVAAGVAYALPVEMLLSSVWDDAARWLPRGLLDGLAAGGTPLVSYGRASALVALYTVGALTVMAVLFTRRDVTA